MIEEQIKTNAPGFFPAHWGADVPQLTTAYQNSLVMIGCRGAENMTERDLDLYEKALKTARREIKLAEEKA